MALTSEESHYSIVKGANWLGLGVENVIKVKTDEGKIKMLNNGIFFFMTRW